MKKSTIALIVAAVVCLGLSVFSAKASVTRTNEAIEEIGEVTYSEDCKAKIDRAVEYYNALDKNLDLQEKVNEEDMKNFDAAKIEYARLAIKAASVADARKVPEGYTSDDIKKFVTEAREVVDSYLSADQTSMVPNYADLTELEKEYAYGDFNAHSRADEDRQDGIDTFEDKDIVFQDITYDQLIDILGSEGNYMIQLSGSWCHNSRAMSPFINKYAKEYGIDTVYSYDFNINNGDDGSLFVRMSNEKTTPGTKLNYMYGEMVSRYLTNLDDWIEHPASDATALSYTNADGKEVTVGRLQQPIVLVYNKDNKVDYSNSGNGSTSCPIMYAFEKMVDRDSKGIYTKRFDDDGNPVLDENGNQIRDYITDEYDASVKEMFDFIKDNGIEMSKYSKTDHLRDAFNSYGSEIFSADQQINVYPVTYRQLKWLLNEDGNAMVMIGGAGDEKTRAVISRVNDYAVKNNVRVYLYDPQVDGDVTTGRWGYKQSMNILDENAIVNLMYTDLVKGALTNLEVAHSMSDGTALIQEPFLFAFNKDAKDADGFTAPIKAWAELTYTQDPETRYYIGKEANQKSCDSSIESVFAAYAGEETAE